MSCDYYRYAENITYTMWYSWTKSQKHQGKTSSQVCIRTNDYTETAFSWEKQNWKMSELHFFIFLRESFNTSLMDSALVGWAEKFSTLIACLSAAVENQATAQCQWTSMAGGVGRTVLEELLLPYWSGSKQMPFTAMSALSYYCFLSA